jgi:two-component system, response regulator YesN
MPEGELSDSQDQVPCDDWRVIKAQTIIANHYSDPALSLFEVSRRVGVSVQYLGRLFRRHTNRGFHDHLKGIRLERARDLLAASNATVHEVAVRVGYDDTSNFIRLFRQTYGLTPHAYAQTVRKTARETSEPSKD